MFIGGEGSSLLELVILKPIAGALSLSQGDVVVPKLGEIGEIITARPLNIKAFSKPASIE